MQFNTLNMAFVREIECNQCENWFVEEHFKSHVVIEHMKFGQDEPNVQVGAFCGEVREGEDTSPMHWAGKLEFSDGKEVEVGGGSIIL